MTALCTTSFHLLNLYNPMRRGYINTGLRASYSSSFSSDLLKYTLTEHKPNDRRVIKRIQHPFVFQTETTARLGLKDAGIDPEQEQYRQHEVEHLVVLVNGLNGSYKNWNALKDAFEANSSVLDSNILFYATHSNRRLSTLGGICTCANRLSAELKEVIQNCPNLKEISFLVHSMGGLISRYACGVNYDPKSKKIFGLKPKHFISIATPHLGCAIDGESQVPLLDWAQSIPMFGPFVLRPLISILTPFVMKHIYRRTGEQLFLIDGKSGGSDPLVCRLVQDVPGEGHFLSALQKFKSRTCYANVRHDALVGWPNASLRRIAELPFTLNALLAPWICYQSDPIENAFWETFDTSQAETFPRSSAKRDKVEKMLRCLQAMPWCRIDISFRNFFVPLFAHSHIQVTRRLFDRAGMPVIHHIVRTFAELERLSKEDVSNQTAGPSS